MPEPGEPGEPGDAEDSGSDASQPLSIGEVLSVLSEEFPDITISKIRFLESQGLVRPERNASGYRQFRDADIERLRWILRQQRDHFLPLKVIKKTLDKGVDLVDAGSDQPTLWTAVADEAAADEAAAQRSAQAALDSASESPVAAGRVPLGSSRESTGPGGSVGPDGSSGAGRRAGVIRSSDSGAATAAPDGDGPGEPAEDVATDAGSGSRRKHSTAADVVAALQEDPRSPDQVPADETTPEPAPDAVPTERSRAQQAPSTPVPPDAVEMGRADFLAASGLGEEFLEGLEEFGLVQPRDEGGEPVYDNTDLMVARAARRCGELGVGPRHLRIYKVSAVREAGLVEQVVMPLLKKRNPTAKAQAVESAAELSRLGAQLHAALLARELGPQLAP